MLCNRKVVSVMRENMPITDAYVMTILSLATCMHAHSHTNTRTHAQST